MRLYIGANNIIIIIINAKHYAMLQLLYIPYYIDELGGWMSVPIPCSVKLTGDKSDGTPFL